MDFFLKGKNASPKGLGYKAFAPAKIQVFASSLILAIRFVADSSLCLNIR